MRPWTAVVVVALLAAAGCASSGSGGGAESRDQAGPGTPTAPPSPSTPPPVTFEPVTVVRTGGIAGLNDTFTVTPEGSLSGETREGPVSKTLTATDLRQLGALVTSPALAAESKAGTRGVPDCRDGFQYSVATGSLRVSGTDCGGNLAAEAPTMWKIVQLVEDAVRAS